MADDHEWIREGLKAEGKTQTGLAKALGRAPSAVTALLKGGRDLKAREIEIVAGYLGVAPPEVAGVQSSTIRIEGLVGAGGEIDTNVSQAYGGDVAEVKLDIPVPHGIRAFEVWGNSMLPKFEPGDVVLVRPADAIDTVLGRIALVLTGDGRRYIKRVLRGTEAGLYNLESFNAPTRENEHLVEVASLYVTVPRDEVRRPVQVKEVGRRYSRRGKAA